MDPLFFYVSFTCHEPPWYAWKYSVMQLDRNSWCGNVVFDSDSIASRDEDSILNQIWKLKYVRIFYDDLNDHA